VAEEEIPQHLMELLTEAELASITGYRRPREQQRWLDAERWRYALSGAGRPIVGRFYARLKLAGLNPGLLLAAAERPHDEWQMDLGKVK